MGSMEFEWDEGKASSNLGKHGVDFAEAQGAFDDPLAVIFDDPDHSEEEQREVLVGHSAQNRLLVVCFTQRGESVRLISARPATRLERKDHEENA